MAPSEIPELALSARLICCKVCGGPEEVDKRFLICDHSACFYKYYHISCLTKEQIASDVQMGSQCWYCPSCLCRFCLCDTDDDQIILCDCCDECYHLYCLSPPKTKVPKDKWVCDPCKERREKEKRLLMLHRKDYDNDILKSVKHDTLKSVKHDILKSVELDGPDLLLKAAEELQKNEEVKVGGTTGK